MRTIGLSTCNPESIYLFDRLIREGLVHGIIKIDLVYRPRPWSKRLGKWMRGGWVRAVEDRLFYRQYYERLDREVKDSLFGGSRLPELPVLLTLTSRELNTAAGAARIASLGPERLLVCSAPMLRPAVFTLPVHGCWNVHYGMAPMYRGEHTTFWPLYFRDYQQIGVTIHQIEAGIDTGPILAQQRLSAGPGDRESELIARQTRLAVDMLTTLLASPAPPVIAISPDAVGRTYLFRQRHVWHDWRVSRQFWKARRKSSARPD
jgi:hypothetical protein